MARRRIDDELDDTVDGADAATVSRVSDDEREEPFRVLRTTYRGGGFYGGHAPSYVKVYKRTRAQVAASAEEVRAQMFDADDEH